MREMSSSLEAQHEVEVYDIRAHTKRLRASASASAAACALACLTLGAQTFALLRSAPVSVSRWRQRRGDALSGLGGFGRKPAAASLRASGCDSRRPRSGAPVRLSRLLSSPCLCRSQYGQPAVAHATQGAPLRVFTPLRLTPPVSGRLSTQVSMAGRVCRSWRVSALEVLLRDTAMSRPKRCVCARGVSCRA